MKDKKPALITEIIKITDSKPEAFDMLIDKSISYLEKLLKVCKQL